MVPWTPDDDAKLCFRCKKSFKIARRKHHCRLCGQVICGECSEFLSLSIAGNFHTSHKSYALDLMHLCHWIYKLL